MRIEIKTGNDFHSSRGGCLTRMMLLTIAVMVGAWLLPGVYIDSIWALVLTAIVISLLDNILRPILIVITLPATIVTLGLFLIFINAAILLLASAIVDGFHIDGMGTAVLLSVIITVVNYLLELPNRWIERRNFQDHNNDEPPFTPYEEINEE